MRTGGRRLLSVLPCLGVLGVAQLLLGSPASRPPQGDVVAVVGSSLSAGSPRANLASALRPLLELRGLRVEDQAAMGFQLGDLFAHAVRDVGAGHATIVIELNVFPFAERRYLFAPRPEAVVVLEVDNAFDLFWVSSLAVRREILRQDGIESLLTTALRRLFRPALAGQRARPALRHRLRERLLEVVDPQARIRTPTHSLPRRERMRRNFLRKRFDRGVDVEVLESMLRWLAEHARGSTRAVLYLPPLERRFIEKLVGDDGEVWERIEQWHEDLRRRCAELQLPVADLTHHFDTRPEVFVDYGHLELAAFPDLAGALLERLDRLEVLPSPADAGPGEGS